MIIGETFGSPKLLVTSALLEIIGNSDRRNGLDFDCFQDV